MSAAASREAAYVPEVDGLRAYAMTLVIAIHCGILPFGWMGVWLFFVISGFAVTTSILGLHARYRDGGGFFAAFWQRRARRILPVYLFYLAANAVAMVATQDFDALRQMPALLLFLQNFQMAFWSADAAPGWHGVSHLWTLSTEQQFYLVFSVGFVLARREHFQHLLWALVVLAPVFRFVMGALAHSAGWSDLDAAFLIYALAPGHLDAFAAGALIAVHRQAIAAAPRWAMLALVATVAVAALHAGVYVGLGIARAGVSVEALRNVVSGIVYGQGREVSTYWLPVLGGVTLLMGILARRPAWLALGRLPGVQAVGRVSYAGYLFHLPIIAGIGLLVPGIGGSIPGRLLLFVAAFAVTVAASWLSWVLLERRFLKPRGASPPPPLPASLPGSGLGRSEAHSPGNPPERSRA
jgi:peptidoglycan/LPS O-acetylase OafA/YrhL